MPVDYETHHNEYCQRQGNLEQDPDFGQIGSRAHSLRQEHQKVGLTVGKGGFHDGVFGEVEVNLPRFITAQAKPVAKPVGELAPHQRVDVGPDHGCPGIFPGLKVFQPSSQRLFISRAVHGFGGAPPIPQGLLVRLCNKAHLTFGFGPHERDHPEQRRSSQRKDATQFP